MNNLFRIELVIWFKVSYAEKDNAKKLKCRWCPKNKGWYTIIKHDSLDQLLENPFDNLPARFYVLKFDRISSDHEFEDGEINDLTNLFLSLQKKNLKRIEAKKAQDILDEQAAENSTEIYHSDSD
jgi:hypothetical protein